MLRLLEQSQRSRGFVHPRAGVSLCPVPVVAGEVSAAGSRIAGAFVTAPTIGERPDVKIQDAIPIPTQEFNSSYGKGRKRTRMVASSIVTIAPAVKSVSVTGRIFANRLAIFSGRLWRRRIEMRLGLVSPWLASNEEKSRSCVMTINPSARANRSISISAALTGRTSPTRRISNP